MALSAVLSGLTMLGAAPTPDERYWTGRPLARLADGTILWRDGTRGDDVPPPAGLGEFTVARPYAGGVVTCGRAALGGGNYFVSPKGRPVCVDHRIGAARLVFRAAQESRAPIFDAQLRGESLLITFERELGVVDLRSGRIGASAALPDGITGDVRIGPVQIGGRYDPRPEARLPGGVLHPTEPGGEFVGFWRETPGAPWRIERRSVTWTVSDVRLGPVHSELAPPALQTLPLARAQAVQRSTAGVPLFFGAGRAGEESFLLALPSGGEPRVIWRGDPLPEARQALDMAADARLFTAVLTAGEQRSVGVIDLTGRKPGLGWINFRGPTCAKGRVADHQLAPGAPDGRVSILVRYSFRGHPETFEDVLESTRRCVAIYLADGEGSASPPAS